MLLIPYCFAYLFASSASNSFSSRRRSSTVSNSDSNSRHKRKERNNGDGQQKRRQRYTRDGVKRKKNFNNNNRNNNGNKYNENSDRKEELVNPLPPLTSLSDHKNSRRPTYFTCRHTYEDTLINEIERKLQLHNRSNKLDNQDDWNIYSPCPGLVRVENSSLRLIQDKSDDEEEGEWLDPVYALQILPEAHVVSGESIKKLALAITDVVVNDDEIGTENGISNTSYKELLRQAPKGSLLIHALVPGMCKGQTNAIHQKRCQSVVQEVTTQLQKIYPAARRKPSVQHDDHEMNGITAINTPTKLLLQIMLQSPTLAVVSFTSISSNQSKDLINKNYYTWPNVFHPLGLANVDIIDRKMPSSAYRKLMEAMECMRIKSSSMNENDLVFDLGACPGGWTSTMRHVCDCQNIFSIDRSPLDSSLDRDDKVTFIQGDAFTFDPSSILTEQKNDSDDGVVWMISDVIAYPERCTELLQRWCSNQWAQVMIVTMKFQSDPMLDELEKAIELVQSLGYKYCRAKHFFSNKNEVTLMIIQNDQVLLSSFNDNEEIGTSLYPDSIYPTSMKKK